MRVRGKESSVKINGGVAHLGERLICIQKVAGSSPVTSTKNILGVIMERWEEIVCDGTTEVWIAAKMIKKLAEHKTKYPGFDIERMARYFADYRLEPKIQARMCYADISSFSKQMRKLKSLKRLAARE